MTAERPVCLVLMPMYAGFEGIRSCVARVIEGAGMDMRRLEEEVEDSEWHVWLLDSAEAPDLVLVDLTHHNPFVMYELGYVHYRRFLTVFIIDAAERRLPATVRGSVCTPYGDGCEHFEDDLVEHLRLLRGVGPGIPGEGDGQSSTAPAGLYLLARSAVDELDSALGTRLARVDETEFLLRLHVSRRRGAPDPAFLTGRDQARYLATLLLEDSDRVDVLKAIWTWSSGRLPVSRPSE
jgi:hypothetical protein